MIFLPIQLIKSKTTVNRTNWKTTEITCCNTDSQSTFRKTFLIRVFKLRDVFKISVPFKK